MEEILNVQSRSVVLKLAWASESPVELKLEMLQLNLSHLASY